MKTVRTIDHQDEIIESSDAGLPGVIQPTPIDVMEELSNLDPYREAIRDYRSMIED